MARRAADRFESTEGVDFVFEQDLGKVARNIATILIKDNNQIQVIQKQELMVNHLYLEAWQKAEEIFKKNQNKIEQHYKKDHSISFSYPREYHIALIAYTLELNMYSDFNKKTREFKDLPSYKYRSFFTLLYNAVKLMPGHPNITPSVVYRVVTLSKWNPKPGSTGAVGQFDSTTRSAEVALNFYNDGKAIFIIKNAIKCGICLELHSVFKNECEYLISPSTCYTVVKGFEKTKLGGKIVKSVTLETKSICPMHPDL